MKFGGEPTARPARPPATHLPRPPTQLSELLQVPELLSATQRLELCAVLAVGGQPLPLFPGEVGELTLPADPEAVMGLLPLLSGPLDHPLPAKVMDRSLGATFPLLSSSRDRVDASPIIPQRLSTLLASHQLTTWPALARCRPADIAEWPHIGAGALTPLLQAALLASVRVTADSIGACAASPPRRSGRRVAPPPAPVLAAAAAVLGAVGAPRD